MLSGLSAQAVVRCVATNQGEREQILFDIKGASGHPDLVAFEKPPAFVNITQFIVASSSPGLIHAVGINQEFDRQLVVLTWDQLVKNGGVLRAGDLRGKLGMGKFREYRFACGANE
jgi:hypothetical protein